MSRILMSGGAGFLGSHLTDLLLDTGHEVTVLDNLCTGQRENLAHLDGRKGFTFIEQDACDPPPLDGPLDYVMHMASPASPCDFLQKPFECLRAGSFATHNLLELAEQHSARFLLASTSEIYGDPVPEHHPQKEGYWGNVNPIGRRSVYDEAKRYAEIVTMTYQRERNLETRIVRIFNTYGPRMRPDDGRVVTNLVCQALRGEPLTLYGGGQQTRSFCYVSDLADGIVRLLFSDEPKPVNIGNPYERTIRELAETILSVTGSSSELITKPLPFEEDPRRRCPDITKARTVLGWEPKVNLEDGLIETIKHLRAKLGSQAAT